MPFIAFCVNNTTTKHNTEFFFFSPIQHSSYTISFRCAMNIWAAKEISCRKSEESQSNHPACMARVVWAVSLIGLRGGSRVCS